MPFQTFLQVVEDCDNFPQTSATGTYTLVVGSIIVGRLLFSTVLAIREYSARQNEAPFVIGDGYVTFAKHIDTTNERSQVIAEMLQAWREEKKFAALHGWRNELYAAYGDANQQGNIAFVFERAGAPLLGIPSYGVHLNAYVREDDGMLKMWIARRSLTKQTWPGMLDNCVAGGIAHGVTVHETVVKECDEEASIPQNIARKAKNVGGISYFLVTYNGLQPETQYVFDIDLPKNIVPKPNDGEVEAFYLWDMNEVQRNIFAGEFKPNCALVVIDFLIRHAFVTADNEPDYLEIISRLHRRFEFPSPKKF